MAIHFHIIRSGQWVEKALRHLSIDRGANLYVRTYVRAINTRLNTSQADPLRLTRINVYDRNGF